MSVTTPWYRAFTSKRSTRNKCKKAGSGIVHCSVQGVLTLLGVHLDLTGVDFDGLGGLSYGELEVAAGDRAGADDGRHIQPRKAGSRDTHMVRPGIKRTDAVEAGAIGLERLGISALRVGDHDLRTADLGATWIRNVALDRPTVDRDCLHRFLHRGQGDIADGIGILSNRSQHSTVRGQLLAVLASIFCIGDGLEAVAGTGGLLASDQDDLTVIAAYILPVGDLTLVDACDLFQRQVCNRIAGVDDYAGPFPTGAAPLFRNLGNAGCISAFLFFFCSSYLRLTVTWPGKI